MKTLPITKERLVASKTETPESLKGLNPAEIAAKLEALQQKQNTENTAAGAAAATSLAFTLLGLFGYRREGEGGDVAEGEVEAPNFLRDKQLAIEAARNNGSEFFRDPSTGEIFRIVGDGDFIIRKASDDEIYRYENDIKARTADYIEGRDNSEIVLVRDLRDNLPLKIFEIETAASIKRKEVLEKINDPQTTVSQRKELKKQLNSIEFEKNNSIRQVKIQALEPVPTVKEMFPRIEEKILDANTREAKLIEIQSKSTEIENKIRNQMREAQAIDSKDPLVKEYIKSLNEQLVVAKKMERLMEARVRRLESNPLPAISQPRVIEFADTTSINYGVRNPTDGQLKNMQDLANAYKKKENNPEFKSIADSVNSKIESLPEVQAYRKSQDLVKEALSKYTAYAEGYASAGIPADQATKLLKNIEDTFVKPAQAEFDRNRNAGEIALASKDVEIKRAWLEKNGILVKNLDNATILKMDATLGNKSTSIAQMNHYIADWNNKGFIKDGDRFVSITQRPGEAVVFKPGDKQGELSLVKTKILDANGNEQTINTRWPIDVSKRGLNITSPLDLDGRTLPVTEPSKKNVHDGNDVGGVGVGTPYGSVAGSKDLPGRVIFVSPNEDSSFLTMQDGGKSYGAHVKVEYNLPDGRIVHVTYAHLSNINVSKNQKIIQGDLIGLSGNSGRSEKPHLHYKIEVKQSTDDSSFQLVDPSTFDWGPNE